MNRIRILILAIKYWYQGDDWEDANFLAENIVLGFIRRTKG